MVTRTPNFAFELIDFNRIPWHLKEHDNWRLVDAIFSKFVSITNIKGVWANALAIAVDDKYVDAEGGTIWTALVAHTTAATGLFAADRTSNTTYWKAFALDATDGGTWATATAYTANTFVVDSNRYGIVTTAYTSSASYDTDVTNGNIVTLIDLSTPVTAAAASATQAAASAATNNLPTVVANEFLQANSGATGYDSKSASEVLSAIGAIADLVSDTTPQLGGFLDTNSKSITFSQGAAVASVAGDTDIWAGADGNTIHITGTNAITDFGTPAKAGDFMWLVFDGAASVVDSATITVVGNANFQAAANDLALVYALTTSTFLFIPFPNAGSYIPVNTIDSTHLKDAFVADHTEVTVATGDSIIFGDVNDSGNTKRDTVQGVLDLVPAAGMTLGTLVDVSGGSDAAFTSIPTGTKQIIISFEGVSSDGTGSPIVTLGDSGGLETSGYVASTVNLKHNTATAVSYSTAEFPIDIDDGTSELSGLMILTLENASAFTWVCSGVFKMWTNNVVFTAGHKSLSAELTQLKVEAPSSDVFDGGSVNIAYI